MNSKERLGNRIAGYGQLLMFAVFMVCMVDMFGLRGRGELMVSLTAYLGFIFTGVAMQFVGAAIKGMHFGQPDKKGLTK